MQMQTKTFWEHDYETALERAKTERKFVLLDVFNPG
jgi:hypothetical protein